MSIRKTLKLAKIQQLIDLNQGLKNFNGNFQVINKTPDIDYKILIATQAQMDDPEFNLETAFKNVEWKETKGLMGGNILADKNVLQNWYLILKSDNECEVDIMIELQELPDDIPDNTLQPMQQQDPGFSFVKKPFYKSKNMWIVIGIIVVLFFGVFFYYKTNKNSNLDISEPDNILPLLDQGGSPPITIKEPSSSFNPPVEPKKTSVKGKRHKSSSDDLLRKLQKLKA